MLCIHTMVTTQAAAAASAVPVAAHPRAFAQSSLKGRGYSSR